MKRFLIFALILCLVCVLFAGCTKKNDNVSDDNHGMITDETARDTTRATEDKDLGGSMGGNDSTSGMDGSENNGSENNENGITGNGNDTVGGSNGSDSQNESTEESTSPMRSRGIRRF